MSNCSNKVNILNKWSPSNLSSNSPCGGCLKFNVTLNKPLTLTEFIIISTVPVPVNVDKNYDGTVIFNENETGYICRSKLIKNNTLYVYLGNIPQLIKELKINNSRCEYNIKINNT